MTMQTDRIITTSAELIAVMRRTCELLMDQVREKAVQDESIFRISEIIDQLEIRIMEKSYLQDFSAAEALFHQLIVAETMSFEGEAFAGMQVLGMVETRAIDFENVFIRGANEDVFPGGSTILFSATFPDSTQTMRKYSSSPKSTIALAFAIHGFHTTVAFEPLFEITIRRFMVGSSTAQVDWVSR